MTRVNQRVVEDQKIVVSSQILPENSLVQCYSKMMKMMTMASFGVSLGSFWIVLGSFWGRSGIMLGSFWYFADSSGIILGSTWDHVGVDLGLGSFWDHFGGRPGIVLVSIWNHVGVVLGSVWDRYGLWD